MLQTPFSDCVAEHCCLSNATRAGQNRDVAIRGLVGCRVRHGHALFHQKQLDVEIDQEVRVVRTHHIPGAGSSNEEPFFVVTHELPDRATGLVEDSVAHTRVDVVLDGCRVGSHENLRSSRRSFCRSGDVKRTDLEVDLLDDFDSYVGAYHHLDQSVNVVTSRVHAAPLWWTKMKL